MDILDVDVDVAERIEDADRIGITFTEQQLQVILDLELLFYNESSIAEELISEGMICNGE